MRRLLYLFSVREKNIVLFFVFILLVLPQLYQYFASSNIGSVRLHGISTVNSDLISFENSRLSLKSDLYYEKRKNWNTSNLGYILFKSNERQFIPPKNRTFVILVWRYWNWLKARHLGNWRGNPFRTCSVKNCKVTGNKDKISTADAVVIHTQHGTLPNISDKRSFQRWVFLTDESPVNTFSMTRKKPKLRDWANVFNWTMTYRSDSDVPVPYGRTVPQKNSLLLSKMPITDLIPFWKLKQRDVLATALISHCGVSKRMNYINDLKKHMELNVYGRCSEKNLSCPGHFRADCPLINKYLFYLSFENTRCREYMTEKIFYNAYTKGAIPIILGPSKQDCDSLLPPNSFLHVDDYENPKALAEEIENIVKDEQNLLIYHQWRRNYEVLNEHGYFKTRSYHICRVCEALNYNDPKPKVYGEDDLKMFFDRELLCM